MTDDLGRKLEEGLERRAAGMPPNLVDVVERGRRIRRKRAAMNGIGLLTAVAVGWAAIAMPWETSDNPPVVGPGPSPAKCDMSEGSNYGQTIAGRWLKETLVDEDAPGGYQVTRDEIGDTGTALSFGGRNFPGITSYATLFPRPFPENEDGDEPRTKVGEHAGYNLFLTTGDFAWESYVAEGTEWRLALISYPGAGSDEVVWPDGTVEWMKQVIDRLNDDPPSCPDDAQQTDEPTPAETRSGYAVGSKEVVMAFDSDGDIWLALNDGSIVNITQSPETEISPTISFDDKVLVYERRSKFGAGTLIYHRLTTGETAEFADGSSPAFGPLDYLAWDSGRGEVVVGSPFSDWSVRAPNGPRGQGATSFSFAWDQSLELLYYSVAFGHGVNPYYIDIQRVDGWECAECGGGLKLGKVRSLQPDDGTEGEFLSTSFGTSVDVLRVCCRESYDDEAWETAEIGGLDPFDTGTLYNRIRDLDDMALDLGGANLGLAHAGSLEATVKGDAVEWRVTDRMAWFLINGSDLWLLTDGRDPVLLPYKVKFGTVAVAPAFARSPLIHSF